MKEMKVELTFTEKVLGTAPADPEIYKEYIASKAPDASTIEDEVASVGVDEVVDSKTTVFHRTEDGKPFMYNYMIKGMFKNACSVLKQVPKTESSKIKSAYKKWIDGLVFIKERRIPYDYNGEIGILQRPLRAETRQGPRVALSSSESLPAGTKVNFTIQLLKDDMAGAVYEWLDYGAVNGLGQWHNGGYGTFTWKEVA